MKCYSETIFFLGTLWCLVDDFLTRENERVISAPGDVEEGTVARRVRQEEDAAALVIADLDERKAFGRSPFDAGSNLDRVWRSREALRQGELEVLAAMARRIEAGDGGWEKARRTGVIEAKGTTPGARVARLDGHPVEANFPSDFGVGRIHHSVSITT